MAGLTTRQRAGKAAYLESVKDIPDVAEWTDLSETEQEAWMTAAETPGDAGPGKPDSDDEGESDPPKTQRLNIMPPVPEVKAEKPDKSSKEEKKKSKKDKKARDQAEEPDDEEPSAPTERCETLRDVARRLYHAIKGDDAPALESLGREKVEHWESLAREH